MMCCQSGCKRFHCGPLFVGALIVEYVVFTAVSIMHLIKSNLFGIDYDFGYNVMMIMAQSTIILICVAFLFRFAVASHEVKDSECTEYMITISVDFFLKLAMSFVLDDQYS